jgi:hypothetical protein
VKHWQISLAIIAALSASLALAEDFKTINGKEYKDATVIRVEPDGIAIKFSDGVRKIPFTELPKEVQERFHYDPDKAAAAHAVEMAVIEQTNQQVEESNKQRRETEQQKALENRLSQLHQQEEQLVEQIRRADIATAARQTDAGAAELNILHHGAEESMTLDEKNTQYAERLNYYNGLKQAAARRGMNANNIVPPKWGEADWDPLSRVRGTLQGGSADNGEQAPASEADFLRLQSQLDSVRKEKEQVKQQLEQAQRQQ